MSRRFALDPNLDFAIERFIDAPTRLVWEALTKPEHLKECYMPRPWGRVSRGTLTDDSAVGSQTGVREPIPRDTSRGAPGTAAMQ